jgi:hypothetical protein
MNVPPHSMAGQLLMTVCAFVWPAVAPVTALICLAVLSR